MEIGERLQACLGFISGESIAGAACVKVETICDATLALGAGVPLGVEFGTFVSDTLTVASEPGSIAAVLEISDKSTVSSESTSSPKPMRPASVAPPVRLPSVIVTYCGSATTA